MSNITATRDGSVITIKVFGLGPGRNWNTSFQRNVCNDFHAELELAEVHRAMREYHRAEVTRALSSLRNLPGGRRGKLGRHLDSLGSVW